MTFISRFFFLCPFFLLFFEGQILCQDAEIFPPAKVKRMVESKKIDKSIRIDGLLNEEVWKMGNPTTSFVQIEPNQGELANQQTFLRVLYNKQYLYFGIFASDSLGKKAIRATDFKRDFNFNSHDLVALAFDGFNDNRNAMALTMNAYGVQRDLLSFDDLYYDSDWDGLWRVRTNRTDSGWYAEVAVPWQTLRYPKLTDSIQQWGFNMIRVRRSTNETSAFSPFPRSFSALRMAYAGLLTNLQPPPPKSNIRVQPYILGALDRYNPEIADKKEQSLKLGGEMKWAINPNTVFDLTLNTDFAQADVDRQINNITRFSILFPERRQFFLENASLFGVGGGPSPDFSGGFMRIQPFFSRRIGLDDNGNPIPIDIGSRLVYRSLKRNIGVMAIQQRGFENEDPTRFFVGRFSENLGEQHRIGGLIALKSGPKGTHATSMLDGFFRLGQSHSLNTMFVNTTQTDGKKSGLAGYAQYFYATNQLKFWWTQSIVNKDFNPELGFVSRTDVIGTTPGINLFYRGNKLPFKKYIRAYEPGINIEIYHQASTGKLIERQYSLWPLFFNFQNGGFIGYGANFTYQNLTEAFEPLGVSIQSGSFNYVRNQIYLSSDPSKILNLFADYSWGNYFDGKLTSLNLTLQFAPSPHFSLLGRMNRNMVKALGENKTTETIDLFSIEGRFALNPRLQLVGFYQQNAENKLKNYNIRISWEYRPLSFIYLVLNKRGFERFDGINQNEQHAILKLSYLRQL